MSTPSSFTDVDQGITIEFFETHISILRNQQSYLRLNFTDVIIAPAPIAESMNKRALTIFEMKTGDILFRFTSQKQPEFEAFIEKLMNHIYMLPSNH